MPRYKPAKQVLQGLTNYDKRKWFILEESNWKVLQELNGLKVEKLRFTPFIRVSILVESYGQRLLGNPDVNEWQIIQYKRLNENDMPSSLESSENDIMEYLKQE